MWHLSIMAPFKRRYAKKRRVVRRRRAPRSQLTATYTEMLQGGAISTNTGAIASVSFDSIPQHESYAALWRQFCIRKFQMIIIPEWNSFEGNQASYNASPTPVLDEHGDPVLDLSGNPLTGAIAPSYGQPRLAYAPVFTANAGTPSSELTVLTNNKAKLFTLGLSKIVKINTYPVANLGQTNLNSALLESEAVSKRNQWLSTDTGQNVLHRGIQLYCSQYNSGSISPTDNRVIARVYYKVTFSLRDPK